MKDHTIAAYAPNITHSVGNQGNSNAISLDGWGTSYATPQVAAAAAMWLEYHQDLFTKKDWRSWRKTEAVYQALMETADRCSPYYSVETMGEGTLKAAKALERKVDPMKFTTPRERSTIGFRWTKDLVKSTGALNKYDKQIREFIGEMLLTELQQVIHRSEDIRKILEQIGAVEKKKVVSLPSNSRPHHCEN